MRFYFSSRDKLNFDAGCHISSEPIFQVVVCRLEVMTIDCSAVGMCKGCYQYDGNLTKESGN